MKKKKALNVLNSSLKLFPRNLILNQLKTDLINNKNSNNQFDCKNLSHVVAEIFYITASAMASQGTYTLSNFYLSLAKYLNPDFVSFDILYAENFYEIEKYEIAENIFFKIKDYGSVYNWYSIKRIALILSEQNKEKRSNKIYNSRV